MKWTDLGISTALSERLHALGFVKPMPVQVETVPLFLGHKDVVVEAMTGSGKTLAFCLPVLEILERRAKQERRAWHKHEIGALVIVPTRELALQIEDCLRSILPPEITLCCVIGGRSLAEDERAFQENGGNILLGTPGRLHDLMQRHPETFGSLKSLEVLVMDEADRLLAMGFHATLTAILARLPKQRRTGLLSATLNDSLSELIRVGMRNPVQIRIKGQEDSRLPQTLSLSYVPIELGLKVGWLVSFLRQHGPQSRIIVYFATCAAVDYYGRVFPLLLQAIGLNIISLHGRMDPKKRTGLYQKLGTAQPVVLMATDLAARGLDFPEIDWVIQFDAPQDPATLSHRAGRAARAGRSGASILLLQPHELPYIEFMRKRQVPIAEHSTKLESEDLFEQLKQLNLSDRILLEASVRAMVSWIRYYREHQANYIFHFKSLPLAQLAQSFGILRMPRMPELKELPLTEWTDTPYDDRSVAYRDAQREQQRLKELDQTPNNKRKAERPVAVKEEPWSKNKARKERRLERKDKREKKREHVKKSKEQANTKEPSSASEEVDDDDYLQWKREKCLQRQGKLPLDVTLSDSE